VIPLNVFLGLTITKDSERLTMKPCNGNLSDKCLDVHQEIMAQRIRHLKNWGLQSLTMNVSLVIESSQRFTNHRNCWPKQVDLLLNTIKQMLRNLTLEKQPKKIFSDTFITIEVQVLSVRPISAWTQTLPKQFTSARTWNNICELETCHIH